MTDDDRVPRGIRWLEEQTSQSLHHPELPVGPVAAWVAEQLALRNDDTMSAARMAFIAAVVDDLAGSYNRAGQHGWWQRPRTALGGRSPLDVLTADFDPSAEPSVTIAALARSLRDSSAS